VKIVITADSYLPRLGGQEMGAFRLAKYLVKKGNQVRIITTEKHVLQGREPGALDVLRLPHTFGPVDRRTLRRILEREFIGADVVHSRYCYRLAAFSAPLARKIAQRFVVSLHGLGLLDNPQDSPLKRWSHLRYRRVSLSLADAVIATSSEFARLASTYCDPSRIHVIPNGVDTDEFDASRTAPEVLRQKYRGHQVVLAVRRLVPKNGIHYLVQVAPRILVSCPAARFVIGGWGSQEEELKRMTHESGVAAHFDFVGAIPNAEVPGYLAVADVVVFPSSMESTSHACLEAMAMAKPVVATRLGGLAELLGDQGRGVLVDLFESANSTYRAPGTLSEEAGKRLAEAISHLLLDPVSARKIGGAAREHALAHFDWNVLVGRILEVYGGGPSG